MAREHQRTKNNPYLIPQIVYMRVLYTVRDYDRRKAEYHEILEARPSPRIESGYDSDGQYSAEMMPRSGDPGKPTEEKAIKLANISDELFAVEQALVVIPREYRTGIMQNIKFGDRYPEDADPRTYRRWKQRFVYNVAKKLYFI